MIVFPLCKVCNLFKCPKDTKPNKRQRSKQARIVTQQMRLFG